MATCIQINKVPEEYKKWKETAKSALKEAGLPNSNKDVEKIWLDKVTEQDDSGLMKYIHHPDRGAKTSIAFGEGGSKEGLILGIKKEDNGDLKVAFAEGFTFTFKEGSEISEPTNKSGLRVTVPIMKDIEKQASAITDISGFGGVFTEISQQANQKTSYFLYGVVAKKSGGVIGKIIGSLHKKAGELSPRYKDTVNLVLDGYRDSTMINKMKLMFNVKGDVDQKALSEAMNIAYENGRRTKEVLDTDMAKLDKRIEKAVRNKKERAKLDVIFGRSGFMHLFDNPEIVAKINNGTTSTEELKNEIVYNDAQLEEARLLKEYLVDGIVDEKTKPNAGGSKTVAQLAAILALEEDNRLNTLNSLRENDPELYVEILSVVGMNKSLHEVVHEGKRNRVGEGSGKVYTGYDGNGILDVYDGAHEYRYVTKYEMDKLLKTDPRWTILKDAEGANLGILSKESTGSFQEGLGLDKNVIRNGIEVDSGFVKEMVDKHGKDWLVNNNILSDVDSGYPRYRIILTKKQKEKNKSKDNIAHTLYRTWVHNAQLVEMKHIQKIVNDRMIERDLASLTATVKRNRLKSETDKKEVKPFLDTKLTYAELERDYPELAKMYTPVTNISNYGAFDRRIRYVRKDMEDVLIGYPQGSIFKDDTTLGVRLQQIEGVYKQLVQMLKLKMVVANYPKLAMDVVSNSTMLLTMDVGIVDIKNRYGEAIKFTGEMSKIEGRLVSAKLDRAKAEAMGKDLKIYDKKVKKIEDMMYNHPFYKAIKNGFIQSQGTSMLQKEYDTITGLQNTIDGLVEKIMKDGKGNTTKIHDGVVGLMNLGFSVNDILDFTSNISKIKGTSFGKELEEISDRLKSKKKLDVIKSEEERLGRKLTAEEKKEIQKDADTVRYVSEFIAAPSSEIVRQGSRAMQLGDVAAKWTLYLHELAKRLKAEGFDYDTSDTAKLFEMINKDIDSGKLDEKLWEKIESDAGLFAMQSFIDYRMNMPKELKVLSDLGVLLFPAFWMRAQKVIWNLAKYHPLNTGAGIVVTDMLNISGASIVDANAISKAMNGSIIHGGQNVLDPRTLILGF